MKTIPLTQGKVALVDDRFYKRLVQMGSWCAIKRRKTWYAESGKHDLMHRVVMQLATGQRPHSVDHKNQNGLDNRLANLRPATTAQNTQHRGLPRSNTSGFKGVIYEKHRRKWAA